MMSGIVQKIGDLLLHPFGFVWHITPEGMSLYGPPVGRRFGCEVTDKGERFAALWVWFGPVHMVFDRGL